MKLRRRDFLQLGALLAVPRAAWATGDETAIGIGILRYDSLGWNARPDAISRLLREAETTTSIFVAQDAREVGLTLASLASTPLVIWGGDRGFSPLRAEEREALATWIRAGGTLIIDSSEGRADGEFEASIRRELAAILPGSTFGVVSSEHVIFHSFYLVTGSPGRVAVSSEVLGVPFEGRLAAVYSPNDLMGAWARDSLGNPRYDVYPGGEEQRTMAFRFGVNLLMYALCTDYKDDQVHVPFILRRRRWKVAE